MRIIAGEYRGHVLQAPKGEGTRPTTDRVREALMSVVASARGGFAGARVLDAFAGSGALGLEALSRGAASAVFFERDRSACRVLKANIARLGIGLGRCTVRQADVLKAALRPEGGAFDLVFLDPPYAVSADEVYSFVNKLAQSGIVDDNVLVVYEHAKKDDSYVSQRAESLQWETVAHKSYGDTSIDVFRP